MIRLAQYGWGIVMLGTVVLCAGFAVGASTDRSVRRHGVPPDGGSLIADKPQVPTGISYLSQSTNYDPNANASCDVLASNIGSIWRSGLLVRFGNEWAESSSVLEIEEASDIGPAAGNGAHSKSNPKTSIELTFSTFK